MKIINFLLPVLIFFSMISCFDNIDTTYEKKSVQTMLNRYAEAWRRKDIDLFDDLFSDDTDMVILDGNSSERFIGWISWKQRLQKHFGSFENVDISYENTVIKISKSGKFSWLSCIANTEYTYKGKPGIMNGLRMTWVLEKRNKNWIIVHAHFSFPKE